jgi:hypothetical protein
MLALCSMLARKNLIHTCLAYRSALPMQEIIRGTGTTPSERYLARLADKTFLNLWSYPNLFIDKKDASNGDGKELCDLLVVCGDDVIIFSDKSIAWPGGVEFQTAWSRWYRRAIDKSVAQIRGAERWLRDFPGRIFLDAKCTTPFPIDLPSPERRRVHGVIVALGANKACSNFYGDASGTFPVTPSVKGTDHTNPDPRVKPPFGIGDVNPEGSFVHVFDDQALDILMRELDTVTDFTDYLARRECFIRSGHLALATGEEELLAYYLRSGDKDRIHDFVRPDGKPWQDDEALTIAGGEYDRLMREPGYRAKKEADQVSYVWDRLVNQFTGDVLAGTSVSPAGEAVDTARAEMALRSMALEKRIYRRMLGHSVADAMETAEREKHPRFCRVILPENDSADTGVAYVFLILAYPNIELEGGYEQYRKARVHMLHAYCLHIFSQNRQLKRIVGIAMDASSKVTGRQGGSEDIMAIEIKNWNPELEAEAQELTEKFDVMRPERIKRGGISVQEFPEPPQPTMPPGLTRQQRRAFERQRRKASRR